MKIRDFFDNPDEGSGMIPKGRDGENQTPLSDEIRSQTEPGGVLARGEREMHIIIRHRETQIGLAHPIDMTKVKKDHAGDGYG